MRPSERRSRKPRPRADTHRREADCRAVVAAAATLGLREYDFFRLAYRRWFGRLPEEAALEAAFSRYMFAQAVPPWARHLSREVLSRRRQGTLDADALGAGRFRDRPARHPHGPLYFGAVVAIWIVLCGVILNTRYNPDASAPVPLCVTETGSTFYESWARLIAGKPPPRCVK